MFSVTKSATREEITVLSRNIVREWHPDKLACGRIHEKVTTAFEAHTNDEQKRKYRQ
jgi:DnaJ-class molecular chaperone